MEIDELKTVWAKYDKKLTNSLKMNVELLRKMNLEKSKREMNTPLNSEIFSVIVGAIFLIFLISSTIRFFGEIKFFTSGLMTIILYMFPFIFSIQKVRFLSNIDYYNSTIVDLQKSLSQLKQKYFHAKKFELYLFPLFLILVFPIVSKVVQNKDLFDRPYHYLGYVLFGLVFGYLSAIWMYKNWYEKKMQNTEQFLKEIEMFEVEE